MITLSLLQIGCEVALLFGAVGLLLCEKERRKFK
jgi:hypothetical protein